MTFTSLWRRVRGLIGTAMVWAGAWALLGLAVGAVFWMKGTVFFSIAGSQWLGLCAEIASITGAVSGAGFALVVIVSERRGDLDILKPVRFGVLGALTAGLVTAWAFDWALTLGLVGGVIGAICGAGSVVVARLALPASKSTASSLPPAA